MSRLLNFAGRARCVAALMLLALAAAAAPAENSAVVPVPRTDDWWQKRHASFNDRVKQGNVDIVFIGDSITQGWEGDGKDAWAQFYGDRNAVNLGIGGDQTQHVLWRLDNGNIDGIKPKAAVVMIGTNNFKANTAEEIGEGITAIVNKLRTKLPETKILLLAIFPRDEKPSENREKLAKASEIASKTADNKNVFFLDIGSEFLTDDGTLPKETMPDFLHLSPKAYLAEARALEPMVSQLLGEKLPKGFVKLFNDTDLTGWKGLVEDPIKRAKMTPEELAAKQKVADEEMKAHWKVEDGVLHFDGKGQNLCTSRLYEDFEMLVDWKIKEKGDSGIYLRGSPQVQIWDPNQWKGVGSGGLYNNKQHPSQPLVLADNPIGEWNTFRIRMVADKVTVWLNNKLVTNTILENYWDYSQPIFPAGEIELQNHGNDLWFKNVWVREIPRGEGWVDLVTPDLAHWEAVGGEKDSWGVEGDILYTSGGKGGGWLSTKEEYGDFEFEAEFNVPVNGNSGIFIRAPRDGNPAFAGSEIQVLDDYGPEYHAPNNEIQPYQYCGSLYSTAAPSRRVSLPAGTWQKMQITCQGPIVKVKLNGVEIVNDDTSKHADKLKDHPGLARTKGYIGLQNHGSRLDYRNVRVRSLN